MIETGAQTVKKAWEIKLESHKKCGEEIERRRKQKLAYEEDMGSDVSMSISDDDIDGESCSEHNHDHDELAH